MLDAHLPLKGLRPCAFSQPCKNNLVREARDHWRLWLWKGGRGHVINACSSRGRGGRGKEGPQDSQQLPALQRQHENADSRQEKGTTGEVTLAHWFLDHCKGWSSRSEFLPPVNAAKIKWRTVSIINIWMIDQYISASIVTFSCS